MAKILPKPTRTISDLSDDERRVIRARHFGWESASPALLALVFSAFIGVVFGYFPARRAARMDPIDALRHE